MAELRKDSARWDIQRGPSSFGRSMVGTIADFYVFDQLKHAYYDLRVRIDHYTRQSGSTRWNRFFRGHALIGKDAIPVIGIYRPGITDDPGYIVEDKPLA